MSLQSNEVVFFISESGQLKRPPPQKLLSPPETYEKIYENLMMTSVF